MGKVKLIWLIDIFFLFRCISQILKICILLLFSCCNISAVIVHLSLLLSAAYMSKTLLTHTSFHLILITTLCVQTYFISVFRKLRLGEMIYVPKVIL